MPHTSGNEYSTHRAEELALLQWFPKTIYRFNGIKISVSLFTELAQIILKSVRTVNSQNNLEQEQSWRYHASWFQTKPWNYCNQSSIVLAQKWHRDQGSRIKSPEMNPHPYGQCIFNRGVVTSQVPSQQPAWEIVMVTGGYSRESVMRWEPYTLGWAALGFGA